MCSVVVLLMCGGSCCAQPMRPPAQWSPGPSPPALGPGVSCDTVTPFVMCLMGLVVPPPGAGLMHKPGSFQKLGNKPSLYVPAETVCAVFAKGLEVTAAGENRSQP